MRARVSWFNKELTRARYDESVGSLLADIGKVYGIDVSGEYAFGKGLHSAEPDGDEIWALTRMAGRFQSAQFLSEDRARKKGNPDLLVHGEYMDIKTLRKVGNTSDRIHEGYTQCVNRGQDGGVVILSSLRLDKVDDKFTRYASKAVERKKRGGQSVRVYAIQQDSAIETFA